MSSAAPQVGGAELEFPAWIMDFEERALPTRMSQLFCDFASAAGFQVPAWTATGWEALA
jgi:hypothetical protein